MNIIIEIPIPEMHIKEKNMVHKLYKYTDKNNKTRTGHWNETTWHPGIWRDITKPGGPLCSEYHFHAYENPLVAVLMDSTHGNYQLNNSKNVKLWEAEGEDILREGQLKCGVKSMRIMKEIPIPEMSREQKIEIAIRAVQKVLNDSNDGFKAEFDKIADSYLNTGKIHYGYADFNSSKNYFIISRLLMLFKNDDVTRVTGIIYEIYRTYPNFDLISVINKVMNTKANGLNIKLAELDVLVSDILQNKISLDNLTNAYNKKFAEVKEELSKIQ